MRLIFKNGHCSDTKCSQAYYMLTYLSAISENSCVLVHAGLTAIGQACIDVCLEKKCQVIVTVANSEQMEVLKQRFPSVCNNKLLRNI